MSERIHQAIQPVLERWCSWFPELENGVVRRTYSEPESYLVFELGEVVANGLYAFGMRLGYDKDIVAHEEPLAKVNNSFWKELWGQIVYRWEHTATLELFGFLIE